jgi:hypothetical protein
MAGTEKILPVTWFEQETTYFCGPAVAEMFLDAFTISASQAELWTDIKNNTGGHRPKDAPASESAFDEQVCDNCNGANPPVWTCWSTTPEALQRTISARTNKVALAVHYPRDFYKGVEMLIDSIESLGVPAFATTNTINHWVLVHGYLRDDSAIGLPPEQVGKYNLNGVYVLDPQQTDEQERVKLVAMRDWHRQFGLIACASSPNLDGYPVVAAEISKFTKWFYVATLGCMALIVWFLWKWFAGDEAKNR